MLFFYLVCLRYLIGLMKKEWLIAREEVYLELVGKESEQEEEFRLKEEEKGDVREMPGPRQTDIEEAGK